MLPVALRKSPNSKKPNFVAMSVDGIARRSIGQHLMRQLQAPSRYELVRRACVNPFKDLLQGADANASCRRYFLHPECLGQVRVDPFLGSAHLRETEILN
jgi:hypothetical protein